MPLIMMSGFPASGKSTVVASLVEYLEQHTEMTVVVVTEDSLLLDRNVCYQDSRQEKSTRGMIKAAVERDLSKGVVVIADSLNYIKGFRYELYCAARALGTPHCVIYCNTPRDKCRQWNESKDEATRWNENLLNELMNRYETPNSRRKWDNPLFEISNIDEIPLDDIKLSMTAEYTSVQQDATRHNRVASTNYLHDLDKVSLQIIKAILQQQREFQIGSLITVPHTDSKIRLIKNFTMAELRRHRREYVNLCRNLSATKSQFTDQTVEDAASGFVDYLNENLC
eukprot:TRINITY_DN12328_c0_g1_i1.p1 TRINITY_DN12328_c0_g1~~TRINITY_DN12328_c0_g1_i1.p1  ORF type:complete len:283 (+),score=58.95 TRINITY_DN12328_c0_g1_i1:26-874(+)